MRAPETAISPRATLFRIEPGVLLIAGVTLLGFALRCFRVGSECFWLDESLSLGVASRPWLSIPGHLASESVHPPLYFLVLRGWTAVFGTSEAAVRFPSVLFGTLSIPLLAALGTRIRSRPTGWFAALLLCVSPFHVYYSQEARPYALLGLLVLWSLLSYHRLIVAPSRRTGAAYLVSTVLLLHTHAYALFTVFAENVHFAWWSARGRRRLSAARWIGLQVALGALFLPWAFALLQQYGNRSGWAWLPSPGLDVFRETLLSFGRNSRPLTASLGLLAVVGLVGTAFRLPRRRWLDVCGSVLIWTLVPLLTPLLLSKLLHPMYLPRYAVQVFLGLLLLAAIGLTVLARSRTVGVLLALLVVCLPARALPSLYRDRQKPPWREIVEYVDDRARDDDTVLLAPWYVAPAWERYAGRPLRTRRLRTDADSPEDWVILDDGGPGGRPAGRVFFVARRPWIRLADPEPSLVDLGRAVLPGYRLEETATFEGVTVGTFRLPDGR